MDLETVTADPIQELAHDHRELSGLLIAVHDALARVDRGKAKLEDELDEIRDGVESFRDALLVHFAREQEALLPFVTRHVPAVQERAEAIIVGEHDRISAALIELAKQTSRLDASTLASWRETLSRFEALYSAHTQSELAFLTDVDRALENDPLATQQLRKLLAE